MSIARWKNASAATRRACTRKRRRARSPNSPASAPRIGTAGAGIGHGHEQAIAGGMCVGGGRDVTGEGDCGGGEKIRILAGWTAGTRCWRPRGARRGQQPSPRRDADGVSLYRAVGAQLHYKLYWYRSRWYDGELAHFIQADTLVPGAGNTKAYDRYAYAEWNPIRIQTQVGIGFVKEQ